MKKLITFTLFLGVLIILIPPYRDTYKVEPIQIKEVKKVAVKTVKKIYKEPEIIVSQETQDYIDDIFGEKSEIALAVLKHESRLNINAIHYNCIYNGKSTSCKKGDKKLAWSVDCGIGQTNIRGKICPTKLMTLKGNMEKVREIYNSQGLNAWVSYQTLAYLKFM